MAKTKKNDHLGSGLAAIFGEGVDDVLEEIQKGPDAKGSAREIDISSIRANPYQPRKKFDEEALNQLAESIKAQGVIQPIIIREAIGGYELVAGERRLRASKTAGLTTIPAIIKDFDDSQMMEIALLENIQREDLNVIEEANAYKELMKKLGYTQEQLAQRVGKSREYIANTLRLLKLPKEVQNLVVEGKLTPGHVRPLITLDSTKAIEIANKAVEENLSVRAVENLVNFTQLTKKEKPKKKTDPFVRNVKKKLEEKYGTRVKITDNSINISYLDTDDLNRILEIMDCLDQ